MIVLGQLAVAAGVAAGAASLPPARTLAARDTMPPPPRVDAWLGRDKLQHFLLAGLAESAAFAAARVAGTARRPALTVSVVTAAGISVAKELVDRGGRGHASVRDLVWDAAGIAAYGVLLARTAR